MGINTVDGVGWWDGLVGVHHGAIKTCFEGMHDFATGFPTTFRYMCRGRVQHHVCDSHKLGFEHGFYM